MKKLLLLLLFIPLMSIGQITYNDLMSIKSVDTFKKVVIENGYEYDSTDADTGAIYYGFNIVRDSINGNKSTNWATYDNKTGFWRFKISRGNILSDFLNTDADNTSNAYDLIIADIKEKCKYFKIEEFSGTDFVTYSCSESSYKGKIGFVVSEGSGYIVHFPNQ